MIEYAIEGMSSKDAEEIAMWKYEVPYNLYNGNGSSEYVRELLNGIYYAVKAKDSGNSLIGYFCFGESAQIPAGRLCDVYNEDLVDIGLGMNPMKCGKGMGEYFLQQGIAFARYIFFDKGLRLTVAIFNERAIKVYKRCGFEIIGSFTREAENQKMVFLVMKKRI